MNVTLEDRQAIADLMTGWIHRDLAQWNQLLNLFHPDGQIEITWFKGLFSDFVAGSRKMGQSDFCTKHLITAPVVEFNVRGTRAVAETNAMIIGENRQLDLGCTGHNRFIDCVEKRDGQWRIIDRKSIYDFASFNFPAGLVTVDRDKLDAFPREYGALAYLLEASGFPVEGTFPTKGSALETAIKQSATNWLYEE